MGLAVVDRAHRGGGKRHVAGDRGLGNGQGSGLLSHLVVGGDVLAVGLDGDIARESAFVFAGVSALGGVGQAIVGLAAEQAAIPVLALGGDAGDLLRGSGVALGVGRTGEVHGALGNSKILGGLDVAVIVIGDRRTDFDRGGVGDVGGGDLGGVRGPCAVGLLVLDHHIVAVRVSRSRGTGSMRGAVVNRVHRFAGKRHAASDRRLFHQDPIGPAQLSRIALIVGV